MKFNKSDQEMVGKKKNSYDIGKSENDVKSDKPNRGEWIVVDKKKKKKKKKKKSEIKKSDKNGTVKVMKSKRGNYWVLTVKKKKN